MGIRSAWCACPIDEQDDRKPSVQQRHREAWHIINRWALIVVSRSPNHPQGGSESSSLVNSRVRAGAVDPRYLSPEAAMKQSPWMMDHESIASEDQPLSICPFERPSIGIKQCTPDRVPRRGSNIEKTRQKSYKFAVPSRGTMNE